MARENDLTLNDKVLRDECASHFRDYILINQKPPEASAVNPILHKLAQTHYMANDPKMRMNQVEQESQHYLREMLVNGYRQFNRYYIRIGIIMNVEAFLVEEEIKPV